VLGFINHSETATGEFDKPVNNFAMVTPNHSELVLNQVRYLINPL
jgi:D-serine deaminase-like pyridoxal phosphate-dependent protein